MRHLLSIALLFAPLAYADSVQTVTQDLKAESPVPFRYGIAQDLAANLLEAQSQAWYGGADSLELSIAAVIRAIGIDDTAYVGWASTDPITWLQSEIAIDPNASLGFSPRALVFAPEAVVTPEPTTWLLIIAGLIALGSILGFRWLKAKPVPPPVINTAFGPVSEPARKRAALNMIEDEGLRSRVFQVVLKECGEDEIRAMQEFRRRYPELAGLRVEYKL